MNKNKRIGKKKQLNMTHHTLESWKHKGKQWNMTKTWQKKTTENDRKCWNSRKMKFAKNSRFFLSCLLSLSCHCLVIAFLLFNHFLNFLAWKQQNHWTVEENQWKTKENQRNYWRKPRKRDKNQWKSEETNKQMEENYEKMKNDNSDGLKTIMPDATDILKGFQNMTIIIRT